MDPTTLRIVLVVSAGLVGAIMVGYAVWSTNIKADRNAREIKKLNDSLSYERERIARLESKR